MRKRLNQLLLRQHGTILIVIVGLGLILGLVSGSANLQNWRQASDHRNQLMYTESLTYHPKQQDYTDEAGQRYQSKKSYLRTYLQLYQPNGQLSTTYDSDYHTVNLILSLLVGVGMVWYVRRRHLNAWLQGLGFSRRQGYRYQLYWYGASLAGGMVGGELLERGLLASMVPANYMTYFSWQTWALGLVAHVAVALLLLTLSATSSLVMSNALMPILLGYFLYMDWSSSLSLIISSHEPDDFARALSQSAGWGILLTVGLIIGCGGLGVWLAGYESSERQEQVVTISWLRLPVLLLMSLIVTRLLVPVARGVFAGGTLGDGVLLIITLLAFTAWIYQPRWSQRLWRLVYQLR